MFSFLLLRKSSSRGVSNQELLKMHTILDKVVNSAFAKHSRQILSWCRPTASTSVSRFAFAIKSVLKRLMKVNIWFFWYSELSMKKESKNWSKSLVESISRGKEDKRRYLDISGYHLWLIVRSSCIDFSEEKKFCKNASLWNVWFMLFVIQMVKMLGFITLV